MQARAERYLARLMEHFDYVGVLALELFQIGDRLLANEFAPRVHNSGHWTIEGAETSQFENHLRAVLGLGLGATAPIGQAAMVNCIGAMPATEQVLAIPEAHLHDYGKAPRAGRKVGHLSLRPAEEQQRRRLVKRLQPLAD
jgi:5-(carboxyamino)imidazole ribonucleotide synthase